VQFVVRRVEMDDEAIRELRARQLAVVHRLLRRAHQGRE
jgi:hypothetical protein